MFEQLECEGGVGFRKGGGIEVEAEELFDVAAGRPRTVAATESKRNVVVPVDMNNAEILLDRDWIRAERLVVAMAELYYKPNLLQCCLFEEFARPSLWRAHIPPHNRRRLSANVSSGGRAVLVRRELDTRYLEVSLQPLHIFLDLEVIGDILPALSELSEPGPIVPYSAADAQRTPKPVVLDIIEDMDAQNARMVRAVRRTHR